MLIRHSKRSSTQQCWENKTQN